MIKPILNNIVVKPFMNKEKTEGGLFVPEAFLGESDRVEIVAVGNGTKKKPMKLKSGDIGHRVKAWGEPIIDNGVTYYIMDAQAILTIE